LTVKGHQGKLRRLIHDQFTYGRRFPIQAEHTEAGHGRTTTWTLRAREATGSLCESWPGVSWIVELVTSGTRRGKPFRQVRYFITSLRTATKALLRLGWQRWSIESEWHWISDVQLGEDVHGYSHRVGVPLLPFLRTVALNLMRLGGVHSIRAGLQELAHDIERMLALGLK
jgi:hypothetical protein